MKNVLIGGVPRSGKSTLANLLLRHHGFSVLRGDRIMSALVRTHPEINIAPKYADLSMNRTTDYMFSWETMLSLQGNTAPYMQYAYARIMSIFRKAGEQKEGREDIALNHPSERELGLILLQFHDTLRTVSKDCCPHILCTWLYEVAGRFMTFYESCPVLQADGLTRTSRLALCSLTAQTLKTALALLGIGVIEEM